YLAINEKYWKYIIVNILSDGLIEGVTVTKSWGNEIIVSDLDQCQITPKGIEYLTEKFFLKEAKDFLKETKSIVPFI
ncbi:MAG: YjcQ family protein, partial [Enterococcus sp.]